MLRHTVASLLFAMALAAAADTRTLEIVEGAHELRFGNVSFPGSITGTVIFKDCASCDSTALRVTAATTYRTARGPAELPAFLERVAELEDAAPDTDSTPVTIFYSMATGRVTRISIHDN